MSYDEIENSIEDGNPIELYMFTYKDTKYLYTSSQYNQSYLIGGEHYVFDAEYIHRSESLKLGDSSGTKETCEITVLRTNSIALLYQGAPPEEDSIRLQIFRVHGENNTDFIQMVDGIVTQVKFSGSEAVLTITIENILSRNIPKGTLSYFCQNRIYDSRCFLDMSKFGVKCYVKSRSNLTLYSDQLLVPQGDDYFVDGFIKMGNCYRQIITHKNNYVTIKYPITNSDLSGSFMAYPGCSNLFTTCARRFHNTDNFSGIPYIQPYNAYKHKVINDCAYWVDDAVIRRDTNGELGETKLP